MNEAKADRQLTMSSLMGKLVLALIRGSDYAHAGEEEAIEMVLGCVKKDSNQRLLDVGCGIGGTAKFVQEHGWGQVTGIDFDPDNIEAARSRHSGIDFLCSDAAVLDQHVEGLFHAIYSFNAFFLFEDQQSSLRAMRAVATEGAKLAIFDYVDRELEVTGSGDEPSTGMRRALKQTELQALMDATKWHLDSCVPMHDAYLRWYAELVERIQSMREQIIEISSEEFYEFVLTRYRLTRDDVAQGRLGGATFYATAI